MSLESQLRDLTLGQDEERRLEFVADVEGWARVHGLVMGSGAVAPISFIPHPIKREVFEEGLNLAPLFGRMVQNISEDPTFLIEAHKLVSDDFTTRLLRILTTVTAEGIRQPVAMGIHRSDYMIHHGKQAQQVELNTISSAFGALASRISMLHDYLMHTWMNLPAGASLPSHNPSLERFPAAFNAAVTEYSRGRNAAGSAPVVMMIVQPGERNSIDQRWLQSALFEKCGIKMIRRSLADVAARGSLRPDHSLVIDGHEVAVAYYRAGYTPADYPTEKEWDARLMIERSLAVKCPNISYHLAGTKKVQQVLYDQSLLRKYLPKEDEAATVFRCFTDQYSLDPGQNAAIIEEAKKSPHEFVMKPQREGGGNLIANEDMVKALNIMSEEERANYILMRRIIPVPTSTACLRDSKITWLNEAITEFGVFTLFVGKPGTEIVNEYGGWLLRSKDQSLEDGGVAAGRAVLDSPLLV